MKNLESDLKNTSNVSTISADRRVYQQKTEKDINSSKEYRGLRLLDETPFRGGTSIKYWM